MSTVLSLKKKLENSGKLAILGVGSEHAGDDIAGILAIQEIDRVRKSFRIPVKTFKGFTAPENVTGEIRKFKPSHILIIDAADFGKKPGSVEILTLDGIDGVSFSTHRLPIKILADYCIKTMGCEVTVLGIQPKSLTVDTPACPAVVKASKKISGMLGKIFRKE
ncbi:MAG: hydrogenase 3 maturation endopeptidase HyCI [Candidatus Wallbacteria bacterium]|nr:hydrogenase 3 maturation endopeptidase HyCI [Candidatus Wallbacteria bacterium]